jgi:epoxyqueuosine reductase
LSSSPFSLCGSCTKCLDACPTKAIIAPGLIDARRCLSYLTIENKKSISKKFHAAMRQHKILFGCDICQEVCPRNAAATKKTTANFHKEKFSTSIHTATSIPFHPEFFSPCIAGDSQNLQKLLSLKSEKAFLSLFAGSPLMRAKLKGLKRNAKILTTKSRLSGSGSLILK